MRIQIDAYHHICNTWIKNKKIISVIPIVICNTMKALNNIVGCANTRTI